MDYRPQLQARLHPSLGGLNQGYGLEWLNNALNSLDTAGMRLTTKAFLSGMGDLGKVNGFLLEISTALAVMAAFPTAQVSSERKDGVARKPCDITVETGKFRGDLQCKNILNIYSEHFVEEFLSWAESTYSSINPGRLIEIQPSISADENTFLELRPWFTEHWEGMKLEQMYTFQDAEQRGTVWITLLPYGESGIHEGVTLSASSHPNIAHGEDESLIRRKILNRCRDAKPTFGFAPGPQQFNFVVVDLPSLSATLDEESLVTALYGSESLRQTPSGGYQITTLQDGLFYTHADILSFCSGLVLCSGRKIDEMSCVLFPNSPHINDIRRDWDGKGTFKFTNLISFARH
jgi:hypothetical protein